MKYRKKPVVIDAVLYTGQNVTELWEAFGAGDIYGPGGKHSEPPGNGDDPSAYIETMEGVMRASPGDYVIRGVVGELYPCKPDIFEATYELVESGAKTDG